VGAVHQRHLGAGSFGTFRFGTGSFGSGRAGIVTDPTLADEALADETGPEGNRVVGALSRSVLEYLAKAIVDDPESVVVEGEEGRRALTLRLHVAPSDMGRIIGRRGRVAQAIRTVVRAAGAREGVETVVDIVD
jgi:predicted RNA-binding protein YlqC (UPF0109 family)